MILAGYRSNQPGGIQSNEFQFSVVDEKVANTLLSNSGAYFELHYKEYLGSVPWRGMSEFYRGQHYRNAEDRTGDCTAVAVMRQVPCTHNFD